METNQESQDSFPLILNPDSWTDELDLEAIFDTSQPLEVDVGCGKGRFLIARASKHPEINFIGIDRLKERLRKVNKKAVRADLKNVKLLGVEARYTIEHLIPNNAVSAFHILFNDPWPKNRHKGRRMFQGPFLEALHNTLAMNGEIHVATDHESYFNQIKDLIENDDRFENIPAYVPTEDELTGFEIIFVGQGLPIYRFSCRKRSNP